MITNSANFVFLSAQPAGDYSCIVPADDYLAAIDICRAIGATEIRINNRAVSHSARHGDQMIIYFRGDWTPEELCAP